MDLCVAVAMNRKAQIASRNINTDKLSVFEQTYYITASAKSRE